MGLPLFPQTRLHVTFGTRAFFPAVAAPQQGSQALLHYMHLFIALSSFGEMQLGWRILHVGTSMLHQPHGYLQGQWYFCLAELRRLNKQRGVAVWY